MTDDDDDKLIQKSAAADRVRLVRASVLHLVDFKRGKYSPRFCELTVCPKTDSIVAQPQRRPTRGPGPAPFAQTMLLRRRQRL